MEIRPVGLPSLFGGSSTSDAAPASNNAGSSSDSLSSAASKESWGSCATRWLCFGPNLVWTVVKKIVNILTIGYLCSDKPSQKDVRASLEAVLAVWNDKSAKPEEKDAAFTAMSPRVREEMLDEYVAVKRAAQLGTKATSDQVADWNTEHAQKVRDGAEQRIADRDVSLVDSMIAHAADDVE